MVPGLRESPRAPPQAAQVFCRNQLKHDTIIKTSFKVLLFFIDFIENRTRNGLSQKTALKTVKNILTEKNKHDCIMNVLEEPHKTPLLPH